MDVTTKEKLKEIMRFSIRYSLAAKVFLNAFTSEHDVSDVKKYRLETEDGVFVLIVETKTARHFVEFSEEEALTIIVNYLGIDDAFEYCSIREYGSHWKPSQHRICLAFTPADDREYKLKGNYLERMTGAIKREKLV